MRLLIQRHVLDAMLNAARKATPLEACGLLGGALDDHVTEFYELINVDASGEHYSMKPEEQFAAVRDMRGKGARMLAIWHSHPETPARMSEEDLLLAYTPDVVYVIVSLVDPNQPDIRGFVISEAGAMEVDLIIINEEKTEI